MCEEATVQEAQKAKALWKMKAAKEVGEEYYDTTRVDMRCTSSGCMHGPGPGSKISLSLQDWELAKVALCCHIGTCCARKWMRLGSGCTQQEACCHGMSALRSPWTGRDS